MPALTPTIDDIKSAEPWKAGVYKVRVLTHEEKDSKPNKDTGDVSKNDWVQFEIVDDSDMSGRKLRHCFSEKFVLPAINFFRALGAKIEPGVALQWDKTEGRELKVVINLELYNGRPMPKIVDFIGV